jgi:endogenous inhibitor of DNA gyrase (YacG/DUF329 family)
MRRFTRPLVPCASCGAKIYWEFNFPDENDENTISAKRREPPAIADKCPRCGKDVDTTIAYAALPGFPPAFESLKAAYADFVPVWEYGRHSFESEVSKLMEGKQLADVEGELSGGKGWEWYRQRLFYRSCTAFYRSLQLFFAYLVLERRCFTTWADVTGYYSRFFFIQAFLNLALCTWNSLDNCVFHFDGKQVHCTPKKNLTPTVKTAGAHEIWWQLMEAMKVPTDYPLEHGEFVLSRLVFDPERRNNSNYGFEYLQGGFIELDWFDSGAKQMMNHFMPYARPDRDITDIDRFFDGRNPEECDVADFYADESQILWCSLKTYLDTLKLLGIKQQFILTENIAALSEIHLRNDYPKLMKGILLSAEESLQTGFDVNSFTEGCKQNPDRRSAFLP